MSKKFNPALNGRSEFARLIVRSRQEKNLTTSDAAGKINKLAIMGGCNDTLSSSTLNRLERDTGGSFSYTASRLMPFIAECYGINIHDLLVLYQQVCEHTYSVKTTGGAGPMFSLSHEDILPLVRIIIEDPRVTKLTPNDLLQLLNHQHDWGASLVPEMIVGIVLQNQANQAK